MDPDEQLASALAYATQQARYYDPCEIERLARMIGLARATHDPDLQSRTLELLSAWHEHMISVRKGGPGIPPPAALEVISWLGQINAFRRLGNFPRPVAPSEFGADWEKALDAFEETLRAAGRRTA